MSIIVALNHVTHYRYDRAIRVGMQTVRLRPAPHTRTVVRSYSLNVTPKDHFTNWQQDPFGNYQARLVFPEKIRELRVEIDLTAEIRTYNPFDFFLEDYAKDFPFAYEPMVREELAPYLEIKESGPLLKEWANAVSRNKRGMIDFLVDINRETYEKIGYLIRMEPGVQTCEETLGNRSGSCRDMAWLLCQLLRHLGFATRFASGYLIQLVPDIKPVDGAQGPTKDFTDLHAWTEVYLPGAGWIGLDSTSGLFTGEGHIPLCSTPNPSSAAPVSGTLEPCSATLEFHMELTRIEEAARVTKPYAETEWRAIDALGAKVDKALAKGDVRLTMGGEPTFISDEDRAGAEWHYTALSDDKTRLGREMLMRLKKRFAPNGLTQYAQGKWYPGEILPRWAMNCFWRQDGEPLWLRQELLADPLKKGGQGDESVRTFFAKLAGALGIPEDYILPAYEDADYYAWKEKTLPVEGASGKLDEYEGKERARLKALQKKIERPSGYVLPLHFSFTRKRWVSNRWRFKAGRLTLMPGDSPVGLRLPLLSLPFVKGAEKDRFPKRDSGPVKKLGSHAALQKAVAKREPSGASFAKDPVGQVKSALCAELRNGTLHLFLPPLEYLEHFLDLAAAVEQVAEATNLPLVIEGYGPPADLRLTSFSVTPDPGVLEINMQPSGDWEELKSIMHAVYDDARLSRLSAEKFLIDGRRVGTGGGNHIVIGAAVPTESPFLRRPDLLASLITFWQHHPSLSYLFSSLYIGPTSQSPRIDEARHDSLYEMEIALQQLRAEKPLSAPMIDRLLRNLLVDLTGNTHRAEFCIDKLWSFDGRKFGLLEMRAFEMMPHPRMNLLMALMLRALVAHFWEKPYTGELVRWGTRLHDRFMLPYYLREDFHEVLAVLREGGFAFKPEWFEPFFTFRFPECGHAQVGAVRLELHMALEPWPVLGEEMAAGGTSRSVDSSVERLQLTVHGLVEDRHIVTCNGRRLPLSPTRDKETFVAGLRYKAWDPPASLHPGVPVHTPLVFDVLDAHLSRSLGGCTYHVVHPGGRSYDTIPVNENEAEGRRLSRFEAMGHKPGKRPLPPEESNPDFPHTLDLRFT